MTDRPLTDEELEARYKRTTATTIGGQTVVIEWDRQTQSLLLEAFYQDAAFLSVTLDPAESRRLLAELAATAEELEPLEDQDARRRPLVLDEAHHWPLPDQLRNLEHDLREQVTELQTEVGANLRRQRLEERDPPK